MYTFSIAARYMRKRPISVVVVLLVSCVVCMYLVVISVLEGFKNHYMQTIQSVMAHTTVDVGQFAWGIEQPRKWSDEVLTVDPGIRGITTSIETPSMAVFESARTIGTLHGINLTEELKYGSLKNTILPKGITEFGEHDDGGRKVAGCLAGEAWRKKYNLKIGSRIVFLFTDEEDEPRTVAFKVIGFFNAKNPGIEQGAFVDRDLLAEKIKVSGRAKNMLIWLQDPNRPDLLEFRKKVAAKMQTILKRDHAEMLPKLEVETWQDRDSEFYEAVARENWMMRVILYFFLLLIAFILYLVFGRMVAEKVRDIGALRALGATPSGIRACFIMQGLFVGVLGLLLGYLAAVGFLNYMNEILDRIGYNPVTPGESLAVNKIPFQMLPLDLLLISCVTLFFAFIGAFFPAWQASRLNPVECLRHE